MNNHRKKKISSLNHKYYQDIITLLPGHVYWKDQDGVFLGCNLQQARDAGFKTPDEIIGKTDGDMPWSIQTDYLREIDLKVMKSGRTLTLEELFELPDGTKKIYLSKKMPLYDERNQVSGILGISFDITERKNLEEALVKTKELAEEANRVKTEFLENMRHDLRTPLTGIVGFAEIIRNEAKDVKIKEYTDNLIAASQTLLEFLNGILEAIKVLSGDIPTVKKKFSLSDAITKVIQLIKPKVIEKKLDIKLKYDKAIPKYVIGDPARIQRIILELVSNALNFTYKGKITVTVELAKKEERELIIKCSIKDTGIGILADKQDEIFLRFKRLSPSYEGIYKGAGLGLTIVKQFIDDIKGEIYCQSKIGQGSIFTCLIPLQESLLDDNSDVSETEMEDIRYDKKKLSNLKKAIKSKTKKGISKTHVLIVEDQSLAAKVAESIIERLDCTVDIAQDGNHALKLFKKNKYNLIFMDVGLPDLSGNEVVKRMRMQEWKLDEHVPIVALTAHIDSENKQECINAGMDAVLSKPLAYDTAKDIVNAFVPGRKPVRKLKDSTKKTKSSTADALLNIKGNVIDLSASMAKINCDAGKAKEMINVMVEEFQEDMPQLAEAKKNNDWNTVKSLVHKHRGGSLYCGVPRFQEACTRLENYLIQNKTELREQLYKQLLAEFDKVCKKQLNL